MARGMWAYFVSTPTCPTELNGLGASTSKPKLPETSGGKKTPDHRCNAPLSITGLQVWPIRPVFSERMPGLRFAQGAGDVPWPVSCPELQRATRPGQHLSPVASV